MAIMFDIHRFNNIYERWVCCNLCLKIKGFRYDIKAFPYAKRFTYDIDGQVQVFDLCRIFRDSFLAFSEILFWHLQDKPLYKISPKLNTKLFRCIKTDPKNKILSELFSSVFFWPSKTGQNLHQFRQSYAVEASEKVKKGGGQIRRAIAARQVKI